MQRIENKSRQQQSGERIIYNYQDYNGYNTSEYGYRGAKDESPKRYIESSIKRLSRNNTIKMHYS
jgi:hypothetical protein